MNEERSRAIIEQFAKKQQDGHFACPRCGMYVMGSDVTRNALSRRADVYVCDACGMCEALEDMMDSRTPLAEWAIAQEPELWRMEE